MVATKIIRFQVVCLMLMMFTISDCAWAQFDTGSVLGTIRDPQGAVIPSSQVTLENIDTGIRVQQTADSAGRFEFFNVKFGQYAVTAEQPGFRKGSSGPFTVSVSARQRVDLTLEVGGISEIVEVADAATPLETDSSSKGTVIGHTQIIQLPLNGRAYADLTLLSPGANQALKGSLSGRDASYNVNGLRSSYNNFILDGVDNNSYGTSNQGFSNQVVQLAPDAVGEFKVITNNYSAEYGRAGGAVVNASLRSGTNNFHATLWEFHRNDKLNAVGFFKPQNGKPKLIQNQFGAAISGPIVQNKTFFFGDYEGRRRVQKELVFASIPTLDQREGRFGIPVADPYTGTVFADGVVPQDRMTPFAKQVLAGLPAPNRPGMANNYESLPGRRLDDNKGDLRIDHYFNDRATTFFRFSHRKFNEFEPDEIPLPSGGNSNGDVHVLNRSIAGGVTYTLSAASLLEFRMAFTRTEAGKTPIGFDLPHLEDQFGIGGLPRDERVGGGLNTQSVSGFDSFGRQNSNPQFQDPDVWNPRINYTHIRGVHSLKFGYEYQRISTEINDLSPVYGLSAYSGQFSRPSGASSNNLYNLADFMFGAQSRYELSKFVVLEYQQRMHFFYVQDDWKVSPNLTLNLGTRYEFATPQWESQNRLGNFDPATNSLVFAKNGSIRDRALVNPDRNNWGPRLGLAYSLNPETVVRSGYGVSYVHFNRMGGENILGFTGPFVFRRTQNQGSPRNLPLCSAGANLSSCFTRTQDGYSSDFNASENYNPSVARVNFSPADNATGYVQSWHLTIQRELARNLVFDIGYVGNRGAKLLILADYNQSRPNGPGENLTIDQRRPIPGFSQIQISFSAGNSFYHGLQAKLEKRFAGGWHLLNSFTWSKAIDDATGHLEEGFNGDTSRVNFLDRASEHGFSTFDVPVNNTTSLIWELPFGRGRRWGSDMNALANGLLGGWRATLINQARSGVPVNIYYNPTSQGAVCSACRTRPNAIGPVQNPSQDIQNYFLRDNIVIPPVTSPFGNIGRNTARTLGFAQLDLGLHKEFLLLNEETRLEFRAEFFNLLNRTNFLGAQSRADVSNFGTITGTFPARQIQFSMKLHL